MSVRLAVVAEPAAAGLAGLDGSFEWGAAEVAQPAAPVDADFVVALGAAAVAGRPPDVRLLGDGEGAAPPTGTRLVATAGDGLWSRAAWPVRDDLFDLPPPPTGAPLLVIASDAERDATLLEKLAGRGIAFESAPELSAPALAAAGAVAFPPAPDAEGDYVPGARQDAVPAAAFAPLAARRALIAPRARVTFGLQPAVDHLAASTDDDVVQYADALRSFPDAFALQLALGRVAAERQRASVLYGRLAAELESSARTGG